MFKILYSDKNIAVCIKPAGVSSEGEGMPLMLKKELEKGGVKTEVYPLHRLDVPVGGVMVFALNKAAAAELSDGRLGVLFEGFAGVVNYRRCRGVGLEAAAPSATALPAALVCDHVAHLAAGEVEGRLFAC